MLDSPRFRSMLGLTPHQPQLNPPLSMHAGATFGLLQHPPQPPAFGGPMAGGQRTLNPLQNLAQILRGVSSIRQMNPSEGAGGTNASR